MSTTGYFGIERHAARSAGFACLAALSMGAAAAPSTTTLDGVIEHIEAENFSLSGLTTALSLDDTGLHATVDIEKLELPAASLTLDNTHVDCREVVVNAGEFRCSGGSLRAGLPGIGRQSAKLAFSYNRSNAAIRFELQELEIAEGNLQLHGSVIDGKIKLQFSGNALQLASLLDVAKSLMPDLTPMTAGGAADIAGTMIFDDALEVDLKVALDAASLSNDAGTIVADSMHGNLTAVARHDTAGWRVNLDLDAGSGEVYVEPVYANLGEHTLHLQVQDIETSDFATFGIGSLRIEQQDLVTLTGRAMQIRLPATAPETTQVSGHFELIDSSLEALYTGIVKVLAAGSIIGDLDTAGRISGSADLRDNALISGRLRLQDAILDDRKHRFAAYGLTGEIDWPGPNGEPTDAAPSRLAWTSATAYNIPINAGSVQARIGGNDLVLLQPLRLPTMGGALHINRLEVHDYGTDSARGTLDAELEPIQLGQLTGAFGWPAFSGSLSGKLPLLHYAGNAMTVGGTLTAHAFDGDIEVANLRLEQPFGRVPRLFGDLRLENLDLERLTNTFSFGLIQGRLSGEVTGLQLVNWEPAVMDLHIYTPPGDKSKHRISQRAVENLASVGGGGGGVAAALSSGLLSFFEVFSYDRIGLRCVLRDGTCAMSGAGAAPAGPAGSGYYIVKGSGLPRIDVVGYRSRVSWIRLVQQLSGITKSGGPVVN